MKSRYLPTHPSMPRCIAVALAMILSFAGALAQSGNPRDGNGRLPDPRFRRPFGIHELQGIVDMLVAKNGLQARFTVRENPDALSSVARFQGRPEGWAILVNPRAARDLPPNTWAFILGHEIAHGVDDRARAGSGKTLRQIEWTADDLGAGYAIRAGFRLEAHAGWVFSRPNRGSATYGSEHDRARNLINRYGTSQREIQVWRQRYRHPLSTVAR